MKTFCTKYVKLDERGELAVFGGYLQAIDWDDAEIKAKECNVSLDGELIMTIEISDEEFKSALRNLYLNDGECF